MTVAICYLSKLHALDEKIVTFKMSQDISQKYYTEKSFDIFCAKFVFFFFKLLGLAPVSYDHVWSDAKKSWILVFKTSKVGIIYNAALVCCLTPLDIRNAILVSEQDVSLKGYKDTLIFTLYGFLFSFGNVFTLIVFIFQHAKIVSIANKISELRELILENNTTKHEFFSFLFLNFLLSFYVVILASFFLKEIDKIDALALYLNVFVNFFLFIQYIYILKLIKSLFESINNTLNNQLLKNDELNKLMHSYSFLCDVSQKISNFYSLPLIWSISNIFYLLLWTTYSVIQSLYISNHTADFLIFLDLNYIYSCILLMSAFVINVTETIKKVVY